MCAGIILHIEPLWHHFFSIGVEKFLTGVLEQNQRNQYGSNLSEKIPVEPEPVNSGARKSGMYRSSGIAGTLLT
jgi:hypothetical protein